MTESGTPVVANPKARKGEPQKLPVILKNGVRYALSLPDSPVPTARTIADHNDKVASAVP